MKRDLKLTLLLLSAFALTFPIFTTAQNPPTVGTRPAKASGAKRKVSRKKNAPPQVSLSGTSDVPTVGQLFDVTAAQRKRAIELLDRSPYLTGQGKSLLSEEEFTDATREMFDLKFGDLRDPMEAVRILEKMIANVGAVKAVVTSNPSNLPVEYHRLTSSTPAFNTTTNNPNLSLDPPATYVFTCTGPGGIKQTQNISCARGCTAHFNF
jgi:hypothetical protein